ncbi:MAG: UDP-N-acetylmuramoyl-tripeptide--D-alanyl-D-alanine ligase, partial [Nitrospirota bacterium]|nr:UDP-N-acetylmuramoyl-tripeptide--D-alanyl-D-alanine ligase [Nitrospirota bacterium]
IRKKGVTVINDSYNANPTSMEESLKELVRLAAGGRKVAVLGDMGELDAFSEDEHRKIGRMLPEMGIDVFVAVGEKMGLAAEEITRAKKPGASVVYKFSDASEAGEGIMDILKHGDTVLIKGSRMMSMEKVAGGIADVI